MVPPATTRTLGEHASALVLQSARSKLLAEQAAQMLRDTDTLFPRPKSPARAPRMFPSSQPAAGTPTLPNTVSTEPDQTNNSRVETEEPENGQKQSNNGRRKQQRLKRSGGYNFEEVCTQCTCTRRPARVHRATQTVMETQWRAELREALAAPGLPGGVTVTLLDDTREKLLKVSREGLMIERKRKSVIRRNIWQELARK